MRRRRNGLFVPSHIGEVGFEAFVPNPLPPIPPLDLADLQESLADAHIALGYLDALLSRVPTIEPLLYSYVRREAVSSSQIEGIHSSFEDLLLHELGGQTRSTEADNVETGDYVAALNHGIHRMREGFPLSNRLLREIHAVLMPMATKSHLTPGEFRRSQNWIGGLGPDVATYVPPPASDVLDCMSQLERFLHDPGARLPGIVIAGLSHAQFESIHPFLDGNGRVGRVLIALILEQSEILCEPALYLSLYFKRHQAQYYALLSQLRDHGDWELWLRYFIDGVTWTAEDCIAKAEELTELFEQDQATLLQQGRRSPAALRAHEAFVQRPMLNLPEMQRLTDLSFSACTSSIETLTRLGIVSERTGRRRNRIFAYDRYVEILSEDTEPL